MLRRLFRRDDLEEKAPAPETDQPFFRFHPGAYEPGRAFERSEVECAVCRRPAIWVYTGSFYAVAQPPSLCARCIASGRAAATYQGGFFDTLLEGADPSLADEVLRRTPGFATFNPFDWPVLDGWPLAFVGYGDDPAVWDVPEARAAINSAFEDWEDGPTPYALVFKEVAGARYLASADLD